MADEPEVAVSIGAKIDGLMAGLDQAKQGMASAFSGMTSSMGSLGAAAGALKGPLLAITGILAGGAIFADAVKETVNYTKETLRLSRALGVTTEEASVLGIALNDIYTDTETYLAAVNRLTLQIVNGGKGFEKLGIQVKEPNGELRAMGPIMTDVLAKLNGMKQGTDQNAAGAALFGRNWGEVRKILKLTPEVMEEARKKGEQLNLIIGPDAEEKVRVYRAAMNDFQDVMQGLKVTIGTELLPVLADLASFLAEYGPTAVKVLGTAMKTLVIAFETVKLVVKEVATVMKAQWDNIVVSVSTAAHLINNAFTLTWEDVKKANAKANAEIEKNNSNMLDKMTADYAAYGDKIGKIVFGSGAKSSAKTGGERFDPAKGEEGKSRIPAFRQELEEMKLAEGSFFEISKARELEFWQAKLALVGKGTKDYLAILTEVNKLRRDVERENHEAIIDSLRFEQEVNKSNGEARLATQEEIIRRETAAYGEGSKQAVSAAKEKWRIEQEIMAQKRALQEIEIGATRAHQDALVALEDEAAKHRYAIGEISQQELLESNLQTMGQRYDNEQAALRDRLALTVAGSEEEKRILVEMAAAWDEYRLRVQQVHNTMEEDNRQTASSLFAPLRSAMEESFQGMFSGLLTFQEGWQNVWRRMGTMLDQFLSRMVVSYITGENTKTMAAQAAAIKRVAVESWATIKSVALWAWAGLKALAIKAWTAAAGAYDAIVGIPYVGPFLAPAAAVVASAAILSFASRISSAAGGWDRVPNDQIAQIHKDEMVLPAHIAESVRQGAEAGTGGSRGGDSFSVSIQALDPMSFERYLEANEGTLLRRLGAAARNGRKA